MCWCAHAHMHTSLIFVLTKKKKKTLQYFFRIFSLPFPLCLDFLCLLFKFHYSFLFLFFKKALPLFAIHYPRLPKSPSSLYQTPFVFIPFRRISFWLSIQSAPHLLLLSLTASQQHMAQLTFLKKCWHCCSKIPSTNRHKLCLFGWRASHLYLP